MRLFKLLLSIVSCVLPWSLRRRFFEIVFGYELHPTSRIGFSLILPQKLVMEEGSQIGHLNLCKGLSLLHLASFSSVGKLNWITGFPTGASRHFAHQPERKPELLLGAHAAITSRHLLDCTARVVIGRFSTFAGFNSQILTHSIDLEYSRQSSAPVEIGEYCFVGTNCVLLGGSNLPSRSVLAAKSLLNKAHSDEGTLYGGVPAKAIKALPVTWVYFQRAVGFVD